MNQAATVLAAVAVLVAAGPGWAADAGPLEVKREAVFGFAQSPAVTRSGNCRLFIADAGNARILSVTLGYHTDAHLPLKDLSDCSPAGR